jgi:hypothetical protein
MLLITRRFANPFTTRWLVVCISGRVIVELAVITLLGLLYVMSFPIKNVEGARGGLEFHLFDTDVRLDALEHERLSGVVLPIAIGLRRYNHIPTWNPYIGVGEPTINNPFNYLFNPFASVPVLLFGGITGTKLAMILALLFAGYNMWLLARVVGISTVGRVTVGALYMMSGGIASKFHAGHFQLGLSLAWMPLVFAGLWWTLHSPDRRAPVLTAGAFALLFFSGNIYYTLHALICSGVIVAFHAIDRDSRFALRTDRLRRVARAGVFAFGLAALQFMPIWTVRDFIGGHPGDPRLNSRYDLGQALANFTFPWPNWTILQDPNYKMLVGVDYAYVGPAALLLIVGAAALLLARPTVRTQAKSSIAWIALVLALVMIVWGAGQTPIIQYLYANVPRLAEFRFVGRAHAVAALWLLVLAGLSIDVLWRAANQQTALNDGKRLIRAMALGGLVWLLFTVYSSQNEAGRAALVLYDYRLKEALDVHSFTSFTGAALGLFALVFAALVGDALLFILGSLRPSRQRDSRYSNFSARLFRLLVLGGVLLALADVMQVNSRLFVFNHRIADFRELYPYLWEMDTTTPFPAIHEPHSPFAFSAYEAEIRNWGLDEGWTPNAPAGIFSSEQASLRDVPRWAIVWNEPGGRLQAEQFVEAYGYEARLCTSTEIAHFLSEECNVDALGTAVLYELPDALPYAFIVEAQLLETRPETVRLETISPARVLSHQQDTITIRAALPSGESSTYYLVVQETHFPGWQALVDGAPVQTDSIGRFIGIPLLPGEHIYVLRYEPPGLATGIVIFVVTLVAIGFYLRREEPLPEVKMQAP